MKTFQTIAFSIVSILIMLLTFGLQSYAQTENTYLIENELSNLIEIEFPEVEGGTVQKFVRQIDGIGEAPYYVVVPTQYSKDNSIPLFINLHGGVSRPDFREINPEEMKNSQLMQICDKENILVVYPLGKIGLTWWDSTGIKHINDIIIEMKQNFNIDDDRVVMGGFSDGASGSYHFGMLNPSNFSAFFPWSGHLSVGTLAGGIQSYAPNLRGRPFFAATGGKDQLYPTERMMPLYQLASNAGAELYLFDNDTAQHIPTFLKPEYERFAKRIRDNPRRSFRPNIYWETDGNVYNRCDWLEIAELNVKQKQAKWHIDYNHTFKDTRMSVGFNHDQEYEGDAVKVVVISKGSPAEKMGLLADDLIVKFNKDDVQNIRDLVTARDMLKRGDKFTLTVLRNEKEITLKGSFPPPSEYQAFPRKKNSGAVSAHRLGNEFHLQTSRVSKVVLYLHPEMVRFEQPVVVYVDGVKKFEGIVSPDEAFMRDWFATHKDRKQLWFAKLEIEI